MEKPNFTNAEEMYREVKGKWNTLYPIYFNSNKSIAEGSILIT